MSTTYGATELAQTAVSIRRISSFFNGCWNAFQERRKRQRLGATLRYLSDRDLMDIGITRGEIDYVASNRGIDPRGILQPQPVADGLRRHPSYVPVYRHSDLPVWSDASSASIEDGKVALSCARRALLDQ